MGGASSARRRVVDPATLSGVTPKHDRPFYMQIDLECHDFPLAPFFNSEAYGEHRASVNLAEQQKINLERMAREQLGLARPDETVVRFEITRE